MKYDKFLFFYLSPYIIIYLHKLRGPRVILSSNCKIKNSDKM